MERLRIRILGQHGDAILVSRLPNIQYLCGFTGSNGVLLVSADGATLLTDGRYSIQAPEEVAGSGARVRIAKRGLVGEVGALLRRGRGKRRVLFAAGHLSVGQFQQYRTAAGARVRWRSDENAVEDLRAVKDAGEIEVMREAARLISEVFDEVVALVQPGITENELAAEAEYRMRRKGAAGPSFESIVAGGARSALPHARPTGRADREKRVGRARPGCYTPRILQRHDADGFRGSGAPKSPRMVPRGARSADGGNRCSGARCKGGRRGCRGPAHLAPPPARAGLHTQHGARSGTGSARDSAVGAGRYGAAGGRETS